MKKNERMVKCEICGKERYERLCRLNSKHHFCSKKCWNKFIKRGKIIKCEYCGKERYTKLCWLKSYKRHFCSRKCWEKFLKTGKVVKCEICGKEKYNNFFQLKDSKHHFCSKKCWNKFYKTGKVVKCEICGKEKYFSFYRLNKVKHHFCSYKCANEFKKGKENPKTRTGKPIECVYCGKARYKPYWWLKRKQLHFCSKKCKYNYDKEDLELARRLREMRKKLITPTKDTKPELKIQSFLKELDIKFQKHKFINIKHGYQCDIFIPDSNLVIECDGDYWHNKPDVKEKDRIRGKELTEKGFNVLRLWEHEINSMTVEDFQNIINFF